MTCRDGRHSQGTRHRGTCIGTGCTVKAVEPSTGEEQSSTEPPVSAGASKKKECPIWTFWTLAHLIGRQV